MLTRIVAKGLAVVASTVVAVLLLEAVLHVVRPHTEYAYTPQAIEVSHFAPSDFLPFTLRPNHDAPFRMLEFDTLVHTNSLGLRDAEVDFSRDRLLCLGDSFTFGFGVEADEAFCARLEEAFAGRYDVVNAGFASANAPDTFALWLARHREALAPRAIVVSLFQNDVDDVGNHVWLDARGAPVDDEMPARIIEPGTIVTPDGVRMRDGQLAHLPPLIRDLLKRSYVVALVRDRLLRDVSSAPIGPAGVAVEDDGQARAEKEAAPAAAIPRDHRDERFIEALAWLRASAQGVPLVIHLIPDRGQTHESHMDALVRRVAELQRISLVRRYDVFTPDDYFPFDGHWTASGHAKAAAYLHEALAALGY